MICPRLSRANASNSTPIVAGGLIRTSERPYDSSDFRPPSGEWHGCYISRGVDQKTLSPAEGPSGSRPDPASAQRHHRPGHLRRDRQLRRLARHRSVRRDAQGLVRTVPGFDRTGCRRTTPSSGCSPRWTRGRWSGAAWPGSGRSPGWWACGHIAIDGKTLCGSAGSKLGPLHLVSAWATQAQVTLGQVAVDGKSNEITAIPELLKLLDLKGALVTIDAIGCQTAIAKKIVAGGGDYVLVVKGNQEQAAGGHSGDGDAGPGRRVAQAGGADAHDARGGPRPARRAVVCRGHGPGRHPGPGGVAAAEDGRHVLPAPHHRRPDQHRGDLLHRQPADGGVPIRPDAAGPLGDREQVALAIGRELPGGRQPDREPSRGGGVRPVPEARRWRCSSSTRAKTASPENARRRH